MPRLALLVTTVLTVAVSVSGCGEGKGDAKAAACAKFDEVGDALGVYRDHGGIFWDDESAVTDWNHSYASLKDETKHAFAAAAKDDDTWVEVQEAVYQYLVMADLDEDFDAKRTVTAACDRVG